MKRISPAETFSYWKNSLQLRTASPFFCASILFSLLLLLAVSSFMPASAAERNSGLSSASSLPSASSLLRGPGDSRLVSGADSRPWAYYWWLKGNVTEEQITEDLEAMAAKGIGGILLFDSRGYYDDANTTKHVPVPLPIKYEFMSPEWRRMVVHAVREAHRLGIQVSMNIANTGGMLRGPWDLGEDGPKELIWSEGNLNGPKRVEIPLAVPAGERFFKDAALIAVKISSPTDRKNRENVKLNEKWDKIVFPEDGSPTVSEVVNLKEFVRDVNGLPTLVWEVPDGAWKVLRFASRVVGDVGAVDVLNRDSVSRYFDLMCGQILKDVGDLAGKGKTLTHFYNVSWEGSDPNWTYGFAERFEKETGYEIWEKLPILRGLTVNSLEESRRFTEDFLKTVSKSFRENCYLTIGELCKKHGMIWHSEDGGPWSRGKTAWMGNFRLFAEADMLSFWGQNDVIQGEFWVRNPKTPITEPIPWPVTRSNARYASMSAHIYGIPLVAMEAFTHMTYHWSQYPAHLKPAADENFIDGANMFVWHTFTASPKELGKPGFEYFAGTHINRNITWWEQSSGIFNYLERCQKLLRKGLYAADVCVYVSDRNYIGWGHGEKWNPDSKLLPGKGWKFDLLDTNVLVNRLEYQNGKLILPHGMSYRILVIDPLKDEPIPVEVLAKAWKLAENGAVVVLGENVPLRNPGLAGQEIRDARLKELCARLWKNGEKCLNVGKGRVYRQMSMEEVLAAEKITADFESENDVRFIHLADAEADRYFVAGSGTVSCTFRASGIPQIYDPVTDRTFPALAYCGLGDGRTKVTLQLPVNGSAFVIFPKESAICGERHFVGIREGGESNSLEWCGFTRTPDVTPDVTAGKISGGTVNGTANGIVNGASDGKTQCAAGGRKVHFRLWKSGRHVLADSIGKELVLEGEVPKAIDLNRNWKLRFAPNLGVPEGEIPFETLTYWNENADPGIRNFSGTCTYTKKFTVSETESKLPARLSLGEVNVLASVRLNGKEAGMVWTAPWNVDLTGKLQPGENVVEIDVTNTWINRLIGDAALPKEGRISKTNVYLLPEKNEFKPYQGFFASDPLRPAGLIGPVEVQFAKEIWEDF